MIFCYYQKIVKKIKEKKTKVLARNYQNCFCFKLYYYFLIYTKSKISNFIIFFLIKTKELFFSSMAALIFKFNTLFMFFFPFFYRLFTFELFFLSIYKKNFLVYFRLQYRLNFMKSKRKKKVD